MGKNEEFSIENKIKEMLSDKFGIRTENIEKSTSLRDDLGIDSFGAVRMIFEIEDMFDIDIPAAGIFNIRTVDDIVRYISTRLSKL